MAKKSEKRTQKVTANRDVRAAKPDATDKADKKMAKMARPAKPAKLAKPAKVAKVIPIGADAAVAIAPEAPAKPKRAPRAKNDGIDIGIASDARREIADGLSRLLADSYTLYLKTHNYHWNVTGPMFQTLHLLFEQQYNELSLAVDLIAERIRSLGVPAPATYRAFLELTSIAEDDGMEPPPAKKMIAALVEGQQAVVRTARSVFPAAEAADDQATADLLTQRLQIHE